jgi:epoxyqueuosine reductase
MMCMSLEQEIKDKALALGLDAVGVTDASPLGREHIDHFEAWLRRGYAGRMDYMHRNLDKRTHPAQLLEGARSVIVVALNYKPSCSIADCGLQIADSARGAPAIGRVAQYAQYEDYHPFLKALLSKLTDFIQARTDQRQRFKICVDSAPLAEKALAVRAGLGFIGRNHLIIHPRLGPQILLGEIVTTVSLCPDGMAERTCAGCDRCLQACPTGALRPDGFLDASRCISYLTQYGTPEDSAGRTDNWLFGCDECLLACPFQQSAPACANQHFRRYTERVELPLQELAEMTAEEFESRFRDSPFRMLGLEVFKREVHRRLG